MGKPKEGMEYIRDAMRGLSALEVEIEFGKRMRDAFEYGIRGNMPSLRYPKNGACYMACLEGRAQHQRNRRVAGIVQAAREKVKMIPYQGPA